MSTVMSAPPHAAGAPGAGRASLALPRRPVLWLTLGAIALRLLLFLGRGDYVAFDEAWYLILGRNLWSGHGFTMAGLRHVALSPLFPLLAGGIGKLIGSAVWGGRLVAAIAGGLLVLPAWSIFRRLGGRRLALLAAAVVAVLPSLAPFVAPELVGWDLWVGAGPLLHLCLYGGIALLLGSVPGAAGARPRQQMLRWAAAGALFGLAYLDRPEGLVAGALAAAAAVLLPTGRLRRIPAAAICGLAFLLVTSPYLLYLHGTLGRWTLTGRGVNVSQAAATAARGRATGVTGTIEDMLWGGKQTDYAVTLYRLDASATRMTDSYWGVPDGGFAGPVQPGPDPRAASPSALSSRGAPPPDEGPGAGAPRPVRRTALYASALGMVVPWFLWPFVLAGLVAGGRRRARVELIAFAPLAATSGVIVALVAIDPRTQLFLAPALAWYAARGLRVAAFALQRQAPAFRRGFPGLLLAGAALLVLLGMDARRLWLGLGGDAVHQVIGTANREVGATLRRLVPPDESVMSWSPAPAVWAGRDWRPLPIASLQDVMTYAAATGSHWIVFSTLNPSPLPRERMPKAFLIARVLPGVAASAGWTVSIDSVAGQHAVGVLGPGASTGAPWRR